MSSSVACLAPVDPAIGCLQPSASSKDQVLTGKVCIEYGKETASQRRIGVKDRRKNIDLKLTGGSDWE